MTKNEWKPRRLDELGFVGRGKSRHRPRNDRQLYGGPYPFIQTADVMAADPYISRYTQTYSEFGFQQSKIWPADTLCMTIAGANTAKTAILKFEACFPDSIVGFIPDKSKTDVYFVKYALDLMRHRFLAVSRGATQDNLSLDKLLSFPIPAPCVDQQRRIGAILAAYDNLIENCRRRIRILEHMAQMIYRAWFVNFRFPGHEAVRMVQSEMGRIPEGWHVGTFGSIFNIKYGKNLPTKVIKASGRFPVYGAGSVIGYYDESVIEEKVCLVTCRGNGSGTVWRTREAAFVTNNSLTLRPRAEFSCWEHFFIELLAKHSNIRGVISGSAQPQITIEGLQAVSVIVPENGVVEKFCNTMSSAVKLVDLLFEKNDVLRTTRDLLLPKLMSGGVSVEQSESEAIEQNA